ncbi:MAG: HAD-IB family phosphatase [Thermoproteota archaeon]
MSRCSIKLALLDVDGVIVPLRSSWGYVHEVLGTVEQAKLNYMLFRRGAIGYWEWMYLDTLAWIEARPGITRWDLKSIFSKVDPYPEAEEAVKRLKKAGVGVALVSGGVSVLVEMVARRLGVEEWYAPRLAFDPWGRLVPGGYPLVEADRKDRWVKRVAAKHGLSLRNVAFVGDSSWDVRGMRESCLSIAVNPMDEEVLRAADYVAANVLEAAEIIVEYAA